MREEHRNSSIKNRRSSRYAAGNRDWNYLGWLPDRSRHGLECWYALVVALYAKDPAQAALTWQGFEVVASGLGNGNGEILGGLMTLLVSWAALQTGMLPKFLNYLGVVVGLVGIASTIPGLSALTGLFGMGQIIWFVWLAIIMLRPI